MTTEPAYATVGIAVLSGVGIDLDHFPLARYRDGDWRVLRALVANPTAAFTDPALLFVDSDIDGLDRLARTAKDIEEMGGFAEEEIEESMKRARTDLNESLEERANQEI